MTVMFGRIRILCSDSYDIRRLGNYQAVPFPSTVAMDSCRRDQVLPRWLTLDFPALSTELGLESLNLVSGC